MITIQESCAELAWISGTKPFVGQMTEGGDVLMVLEHLDDKTTSACDCCQLRSDDGEEYGCAERSRIFTERELDVLKRIREAGDRARTLRAALRHSAVEGYLDGEAHEKGLAELQRLRDLRADLEQERISAAQERMRLLGHA